MENSEGEAKRSSKSYTLFSSETRKDTSMKRDLQALAMDKQRIICPVAICSFPSVLKYTADMIKSFLWALPALEEIRQSRRLV